MIVSATASKPQPFPPAVASPRGVTHGTYVADVTYTRTDGTCETRPGHFDTHGALGPFEQLNDAVRAARMLTYDKDVEDGHGAFHGTYSAAVVLGNDGMYHAGSLVNMDREPDQLGVQSDALPIDGMYFEGGNGYAPVYTDVAVGKVNDRLQAVVGSTSWVPFTAE